MYWGNALRSLRWQGSFSCVAAACHFALVRSQSLATKTDSLTPYTSARKALLQEKAQLEGRLQQLNHALGQTLDQALPEVAVISKSSTRTVRRVKRGISMKAAVLEVTKGNPMTKPVAKAAKPPKKRKMSAAAKAALSAAAKPRWAKIKAAGGKRLKAV